MACRSCAERRARAAQQSRQVVQSISGGNVSGAAKAATGLIKNLTAGAAEMTGLKAKEAPKHYVRKL